MTERAPSAGGGTDLDATTAREVAVRLRLDQLAGSDPADDYDFFKELWESFAEQVPGELRRLDEALRLSVVAEVQSVAHGLTGSAANLGGDHLAASLAAVERSALGGRAEDAGPALERVRQEFHALTRAYAVVLSELAPDA